MVYPEVIHGMFVDLRSITLDDAEFSYNIRADKRNRDTVGQLAPSLDAQKDFIRWQMQEPNDYYFVVLNKKGERIGLIGAYDLQGDMIEVGREVVVGEPTETMETEVLIIDFCKNILKLNWIYGVVYTNNKPHLNEVKKKAEYIKTVQRGNHDAMCFRLDLNADNKTLTKMKRMLEQLHQRNH
jgi:hypothetical protein